jgi:protein-tyrosine phosphatase
MAANVRQIFDAGIKAVVHLAAEEPMPQLPRDLIFFRFPLIDGAENSTHLLLLALGSVTHLLKMRLPTLVCCSAGMSRSPAIVAGAVSILSRSDPDETLSAVLEQHRGDVSPGLWVTVKAHCVQLLQLA